MEIKWKCPVCDSVNRTQDNERKCCFVCGTQADPPVENEHTSPETPKKTTSEPKLLRSFFRSWLDRKAQARSLSDESTADGGAAGESGRAPAESSAEREASRRSLPRMEEPWPEHHICFQADKLCAVNCISVTREEMNAVRGYCLEFSDGKKRFVPVNNMKLMGYAKSC